MVRDRSTSVRGLSRAEVLAENVDVLFMVWLVSRSTNDLLDTELAASGLTGDEFTIYSVLNAAPDITPTELARWMAAPPTTVSSYLRRFESRGHVSRTPNPADRRSHRIRLTAAGRRAHKAAAGRFTPVLGAISNELGGQEVEVREALQRLRTIVDHLRHRATADDHGGRSRP